MRRQRGRGALVGLGALSLACATARPPAPPPRTDASEAVSAQLQSSAEELARKLSVCTALGAKVSEQEESTLGAALAAHWVRDGGGPMLSGQFDQELKQYLHLVGRNLAARSSRPTLPWTFGVLKEPTAFNATSAPGGYVFVTRGLLQAVENEAQLAGVLAHEMAHVTLQHTLMRYGEVKVTQCRMAVGMQVMRERMRQAGATPPDFVESLERSGVLESDKDQDLLMALTEKTVEKLLAEGYTQRDEYAADEEAVRLLVSAGYDPREYIQFLGKLPDMKERYAHHPSRETRQKNLRYLLADALKDAGTPELRKPALPPVFTHLKAAP